MKKPAESQSLLKKSVIAAVAAAILLTLCLVILATGSSVVREGIETYEGDSRIDLVEQLYEDQRTDAARYTERIRQDVTESARLMGIVLQEFVGEDGYSGPRVFNDAAVVEMRDGQVLVPEGAPELLSNLNASLIAPWADAEQADDDMVLEFGPDNGLVDDEAAIIGAARITDDVYYLTWSPYFKDLKDIETRYGAYGMLNTIELAFHSAILIVNNLDETLPVLNTSTMLPEITSLAEYGITREQLMGEGGNISMEFNGALYNVLNRQTSDPNITIVMLSPLGTSAVHASVITAFVVAVMAVFVISFGCYLIFAQKHVKDRVLDEHQSSRYTPKALRTTATAVLVLGTILIFGTTAFIDSVSAMYERSAKNNAIIAGMFDSLENHQIARSAYTHASEADWYIEQGTRIADIIAQRPEVVTTRLLQRLSDELGCDYIMLFDSTGKETLCSTGYTGFNLGNGQGDDAVDFRRLLRGISSIYHGPSVDALTGLNDAYVGVTIPTGTGGSTQGAIIFAVPAATIERESSLSTFDDLLATITPDDALCLAIDSDTGMILHSSKKNLSGTSLVDSGCPQGCLRGGYMDFANLPFGRYFVKTVQRDNLTFLYGNTTLMAFSMVFPQSVLTAILFAATLAIVNFLLLFGYTDEVFDRWTSVGKPFSERQVMEIMSSDGKRMRTVDPSHRWSFAPINWTDLLPERKAVSVLIVQLIVLSIVVYVFTRRGIGVIDEASDTLTSYILMGDWMRGFNLFAICAVSIVVVIAFLVIQVSKAILQLLSILFDSRGETVCRLIYSLLKYLVFFAAAYYSLGYLGFDTRTRLASLGIVSIALSLGAQSLVADIIAGIFIVFEGEFQVGDIIEVGGFRGTVLEIGVRSTKLMGRGYNIKIIDNHDIKDVLNMTHLSSWYPLEIKVPNTVPIAKMEELLMRELPKIGAAHENIIVSGPTYKGVTSIQTGLPIPMVGYSILTECREENFHKVERAVNRDVMCMLEREGVPLK